VASHHQNSGGSAGGRERSSRERVEREERMASLEVYLLQSP